MKYRILVRRMSKESPGRELSVCFLGCGQINLRHIKILRRLRPHAIVAVASRSARVAEPYANKVGAQRFFGSYDEAIAAGHDVYVVGTVPGSHHGLVKAIVEGGHHCLVEKPAFNSLSEFRDLWPRLRRSRGVFMVAENLHFAPFQRKLKRLMADASLGRPLALELVRLGRSRPSGWRLDPKQMPLGALHEGGVHWIRRLLDLASVFEPDGHAGVIDVMAYGPSTPVTSTPHEDTMIVMSRHRSGLTTRLLHTWAVPWRLPVFDASKLYSEFGAVYFDARGVYGRVYRPRGKSWVWPVLADAGGYQAMWRSFLGSVEEGRPCELSLQTAYDDFAYMDAAYRSRASGVPEAPLPPEGS